MAADLISSNPSLISSNPSLISSNTDLISGNTTNVDVNQVVDSLPSTVAAVLGLSILLVIVVALVLLVLYVIGRWKTVKKLGGHGWSQFIPAYGDYELAKHAGCDKALVIAATALAGAIFIAELSPLQFANNLASALAFPYFIVDCVVCYNVAKAFGKGKGFTVGLVLLPFVFFMILGLGKAQPVSASDENDGTDAPAAEGLPVPPVEAPAAEPEAPVAPAAEPEAPAAPEADTPAESDAE